MIKNTAERFFRSNLYLALVAAMVIIVWIFNVPLVGMFIVTALFFLISLTQKSLIALFPLLASVVLMFTDRDDYSSAAYLNYIYIAIGLCLTAPFVFLIKNKQKLRFAPPLIGLLFMMAAMLLGGITNNWFGSTEWLIGIAIVGVMLIAYFLLSNTIKEFDANYFSGIFVMMCIIIIAQVIVYYYRQDDIIETIATKNMDLGWTISNGVGMTLITIMPFCLYKAAKARFSLFYILIFFISAVCVLATLSRGSILVLAVMLVPILASTIRQSAMPKLNALFMLASIALIVAGYLVIKDDLEPVIERMLNSGIGDNGRFVLWERAINDFKQNKLFGAGFLVHSDLFGAKIKIAWYHNHYLQFLGNLGIFGLLAFFVHLGQRIYYMLKKRTKFNLFVVYSSIMSAAYGLLNITYFASYYIVLMIMMLIMTENSTKSDVIIDEKELLIN